VGVKADVLKTGLVASSLNWIAQDGITGPLKVMAKIRYNHKKAKALVSKLGADSVKVEFSEPQEAPTPGQAVVFWQDDRVLGGATIESSVTE